MLSEKPIFSPAQTPSECHDWITAQEVAHHAQAAYDWACSQMIPESGHAFMDEEGMPWADRETFADCLAHFFDLRVKAVAHRLSVGRYGQQVEMLCRCESSMDNKRI